MKKLNENEDKMQKGKRRKTKQRRKDVMKDHKRLTKEKRVKNITQEKNIFLAASWIS